MPFLEHATFDEINSELSRRFPAHVLIVYHQQDGRPGIMGTRVEQHANDGNLVIPLGLVQAASLALNTMHQRTLQILMPGTNLDGGKR